MFSYEIDENLYLRMVKLRDAEELFQLTEASRCYLREFLPWLDFTVSLEDTRLFIQGSIEKYARNEGLAAVIISNSQIAGVVSFNELDWEKKIACIGYWLGERCQRKGIMTKSVRGMSNYAFRHLDMNRVEIRVAVGNEKSRAIPERLGFKEERTIPQAEWLYNRYVDHAIYGMQKEEWLKKFPEQGE